MTTTAAIALEDSYTSMELTTIAVLCVAIVVMVVNIALDMRGIRHSSANESSRSTVGDLLFHGGVLAICLLSLFLNLTV